MKIYSIKEIIEASNNFLKPKAVDKVLKKEKIKTKKVLQTKVEEITINAQKHPFENEKIYHDKKKPLKLNREKSILVSTKINTFNYKIMIKPEVKDHMINELYLYLEKKVKKNTLKLIIDEQLEIKNLKNKINLLKQIESELKNNYESSLRVNEILEFNKKQLENKNKELTNDNESLYSNLSKASENNSKLEKENKELKIHKDKVDQEKDELAINNDLLNQNVNKVIYDKEKLNIENKELKNSLEETKDNLKESDRKKRSYEIDKHKLEDTVSTLFINTKKIQERLNLGEQSKNLRLNEHSEKVKFYQEENIRLSSELVHAQKKNETIKENLNIIETEKEKISNKIKELNLSIDEKTNIIPSSFTKTNGDVYEKKIDTLNDKEQKSLDEVISRIFAKI